MKRRLAATGLAVLLAFSLFGCGKEIQAYKAEGKAKIDAYVETLVANDYSEANWAEIERLAISGKTEIDKSATKEDIDKVVSDVLLAIDEVKENEMGNIDFILVLGRMDYGVDTNIEAIIRSFAEWSELGEIVDLPELSGKFNTQYFENKALIVFALGRGTRGAQFERVKVIEENDELLVKVFDNGNGYMDAESNWIVIIEVQKNLIEGIATLRLETNFYSFSL